jgi:hypothetical protein
MRKGDGLTVITLHLNTNMNTILKIISAAICLFVIGFYAYAGYYGKAFWESSTVEHNTEYTGKRIYTGYGNRFNHK